MAALVTMLAALTALLYIRFRQYPTPHAVQHLTLAVPADTPNPFPIEGQKGGSVGSGWASSRRAGAAQASGTQQNLNSVAFVITPQAGWADQRLVNFLDDLDRCGPEQPHTLCGPDPAGARGHKLRFPVLAPSNDSAQLIEAEIITHNTRPARQLTRALQSNLPAPFSWNRVPSRIQRREIPTASWRGLARQSAAHHWMAFAVR
jgi:hypothetical protein